MTVLHICIASMSRQLSKWQKKYSEDSPVAVTRGHISWFPHPGPRPQRLFAIIFPGNSNYLEYEHASEVKRLEIER